MSTDEEIYDTVLMRDTCGNARTKVKNYFYYNIYDKDNFKYISNYDELILLDVLEGSKPQKEYLKGLIPYLIIIGLGALSWIIWIFICKCSKKPGGCLKRYSRANKTTRRICFFIYFGFASAILILILISLIYLGLSRTDLNGTVCTLSMLRYEMMYGQSLLSRDKFQKPFWYGITSLNENIQKVSDLLSELVTNCRDGGDVKTDLEKTDTAKRYDNLDNKLKKDLEDIYQAYKNEFFTNAHPTDSSYKTIPLYISNLGYKENNETYTGKILYDYQIHYEHLINTITKPILDICEYLGATHAPADNLIDSLKKFQEVISTLEESMNTITEYITNYLVKYLVNLKNIYFIFWFIFISLMGGAILVISILFGIYYFKPLSALYSSITSILYFMNFLMIFCLIFTGITGIFSIYLAMLLIL